VEVRLHPLEFTRYRLPFVCAVTGEPAAWYVKLDARKDLHPAGLLLVLLGPLGWLVLLALALRTDGTYVEVPISHQVHESNKERRRRWRWLLAVMVVTVVTFAFLAGEYLFPVAWLVFVPAIAMGFWVGAAPGHSRLRLHVDGVGLVTIRRVHPDFVAAVQQWRSRIAETTSRL
jgi:hypothetical protein